MEADAISEYSKSRVASKSSRLDCWYGDSRSLPPGPPRVPFREKRIATERKTSLIAVCAFSASWCDDDSNAETVARKCA